MVATSVGIEPGTLLFLLLGVLGTAGLAIGGFALSKIGKAETKAEVKSEIRADLVDKEQTKAILTMDRKIEKLEDKIVK